MFKYLYIYDLTLRTIFFLNNVFFLFILDSLGNSHELLSCIIINLNLKQSLQNFDKTSESLKKDNIVCMCNLYNNFFKLEY